MGPTPVIDDLIYMVRTETKLQRETMLRMTTGVKKSNLKNVGNAKFSPPMLFALNRLLSSFSKCILDVITLRSEKKMIGTNTRRIITFVANVHCFGNRTKVQLPGNSVCFTYLGNILIAKHTIARSISCASPQPACCSFLDKSPKPFRQRFYDSRVRIIAPATAEFPTRVGGRNEQALAF